MPKVEPGITYPRDVAPPAGLPASWKARESAYSSSSKLHGTTYVRFNSGDGKHKYISTLKKAVELDARDKGNDVQQALEELELKKQQQQNTELAAPGNQELPAVPRSERKRPVSPLSGSAARENERKALKVFEGEAETVCMVCRSAGDESQLLLCDAGCLQGMHFQCCTPPLAAKPAGEWFCPDCAPTEEIVGVTAKKEERHSGPDQQTSALSSAAPLQGCGRPLQLRKLRTKVLTGDFKLEVLRALLAVEEAHQIVDQLTHQVSSGDMSSKTLRALANALETFDTCSSEAEVLVAAGSTSASSGQGWSNVSGKTPQLEKMRTRLLAGDCELQVLRALLEAAEALRLVEQLQRQVNSGDMSPQTLRSLANAKDTLITCVSGLDMSSEHTGVCRAEQIQRLPPEETVAGLVASASSSFPERSASVAAVEVVEVTDALEEIPPRMELEQHKASRTCSDEQVVPEKKQAAGCRDAAASSSSPAPQLPAPADKAASQLAQLECMGFSGQHAKNALESSHGDLNAAVAMLLSLDRAREPVGGIVQRTAGDLRGRR